METQSLHSILFPYSVGHGACHDTVRLDVGGGDDLVRDGAADSDDLVLNIDKKFLIDFGNVILEKVISERPHSIVYEAKYNSNTIALKFVRTSSNPEKNKDLKEKFQREVLLLAQLNHANVVKFIGAAAKPALMVATELLRGDTLLKHLCSIYPEALDLKSASSLALDVSRAMQYLHSKGIVLRDLNPSSLLLTVDKRSIKLANFGLAKGEMVDTKSCHSGSYAQEHSDFILDMKSFSVLLWELLTNRLPPKWSSDGERPSVEGLSKEVTSLLHMCWDDDAIKLNFEDVTSCLESFFRRLKEDKAENGRIIILFGKRIFVPKSVETETPTITVSVDKYAATYAEVGVRFQPTDEELFTLLQRKIHNPEYKNLLIPDVDLYSKSPEDLDWDVSLDRLYPLKERYFFTKRPAASKGASGKRSKRTVEEPGDSKKKIGTWDGNYSKPIFGKGGCKLGDIYCTTFKKHNMGGERDKGQTTWIMHEYVIDKEKIDEWVLVRVRYHGNVPSPLAEQQGPGHG